MAEQRQLNVRSTGMGFEVYYEGGGEIPAKLDGLYTSDGMARSAIKIFQLQVQDRVKKTTPKRASTNAKSASN